MMHSMTTPELRAARYLRTLCDEIPTRRVGSAGNRAATDFFAATIAALPVGSDPAALWRVESPAFDCIDWTHDGADLSSAGVTFAVSPGPYTLGCEVRGPLVAATTVDELACLDAAGRILLLRGELTREQLMPKNFVFYNPDHHKQIVALLEAKHPLAIIAATTIDPGMAGAQSPFPLIEDGDFDIPSVYTTEDEGGRLATLTGKEFALTVRARRIPTTGCNVIARKGGLDERRIVVFAHIDAKDDTPGAIDNATGVTALLLLAEMLADYRGPLAVELVAMNGEDSWGAFGEMQYLRLNEGKFGDIALGINMDGIGYRGGPTAYSLYNCADDLAARIKSTFALYPGMAAGEPWYQSDHGLFLMHGTPALALTSGDFARLWSEIAHTAKDVPANVAPVKLVEVARALAHIIRGTAPLSTSPVSPS